jgi:calcium-dependent protein kinase
VDKRYTCEQALGHEWLRLKLHPGNVRPTSASIDGKVIKLLRNFRSTKKLRKEALKVLVNFLTDIEIKTLKEQFRLIDKDNSGMISVQELQGVMKELGYGDTEKEIMKIMKTIHVEDDKPVINYSEFIAATLDGKIFLTKEKLWAVFKYFDTDNTNFITVENLSEAFHRTGRNVPISELEDMIREADLGHDGKVSFDEFMQLMKVGSGEETPLPVNINTNFGLTEADAKSKIFESHRSHITEKDEEEDVDDAHKAPKKN